MKAFIAIPLSALLICLLVFVPKRTAQAQEAKISDLAEFSSLVLPAVILALSCAGVGRIRSWP
jgi:hypothetical protein